MRKLLIPAVVLVGCWTASKQVSGPKQRTETASTGGAAYGGALYGGAMYAGLLGTMGQGGAFASLTGTGDISSGFDDANIYGGLLGDDAGEMNGGFGPGAGGGGTGAGVVSPGAGGGGTGWGTIGTGRYGTIGHSSGTGSGYGTGGGRGGLRGKGSTVPVVRLGQPGSDAGLDKAIIRRYIKRNIQKVQYCYEKEVARTPGLGGTVTIRFTIRADGRVSTATGAGIPVVDSCVAAVIQSIEFPKPNGGGVINVTYPFIFRPSDSTP